MQGRPLGSLCTVTSTSESLETGQNAAMKEAAVQLHAVLGDIASTHKLARAVLAAAEEFRSVLEYRVNISGRRAGVST